MKFRLRRFKNHKGRTASEGDIKDGLAIVRNKPDSNVSRLSKLIQESTSPQQSTRIAPARNLNIQAKLSVSQPGDKYEQEADHVADSVMSVADSQSAFSHKGEILRQSVGEEEEVPRQPIEEEEELQTKLLSRQPMEEEEEELQAKLLSRQPMEEEEEELQAKLLSRQPMEEEEEEMQPKLLSRQPNEEEEEVQLKVLKGSNAASGSSVESGIHSVRSGGKPMMESSRSFFEPRFGMDFSGVKIHTGSNAEQLAKSLNARAFTLGRNIVFGAGQYSPETSAGKHLMAHELTHVMQQRGNSLENQEKGIKNEKVRKKAVSHTTPLIQRRFVNRGRTATDRVWWAGGTGAQGGQGVGSIQTLVNPVIEGRNPRSARRTARAWIRPRTGRIRVVRSYIAVRRGDQGGGAGNRWHMTRRAARRTNLHERHHVRASRNLYKRYLRPPLRLVRRYRGRRNFLSYGGTRAEAIARLNTILGWNTSTADFRRTDRAMNIPPGGTIDINEPAAGTNLVDCGAGNIGRIRYNHRATAPNECP